MRRLLMGNQAIAMAALEAGVNVACGYPGTPSTEIIETIAQNNPEGRVHVEWSCNEKAAMELAAGVSYSGGRVIVTCKQVGMNVASDPFMCLSYVGTRGGVVVVVADDPGPISSQTEQDSRQFAQFAHVPVLDPATPEEAYLMTKAAFEISEAHGLPVILRPTTRVDHGCASIEVADDPAALPRHEIAGFEKSPDFVIFPSLSRAAHKRMAAELEAIAQEFASSPFNKLDEHIRDDYELYLGIACSGDCRGYVLEALGRLDAAARAQGVELPSYRLLQVGTPHPFPERLGRDFLLGLSDALVVEELEPVVERSLLQMTGPVAADAYIMSCPTSIHGRLDHTTPVEGEYSSDALVPVLAEFLGVPELAEQALPAVCDEPPCELVPPRPAVLCAGCPHRASFSAVKAAAAGRKVVYAGDIGCYTLGCAKPLQTTDTCLCMGASVTVAQGLQTAAHLKGDDDTLHVGFVGDSTFFASAMTGLANAVYNRHRMVLCVLDNATTAMTGSQPHPGTGVTLMGSHSKPISIVEVCRALGCDMVRAVDPFDRPAAVAAAKEALACEGVAVVVFQSPCVQLYRGLEPAQVTDACRACGRCVRQTGCPALSMAPDCEGQRGPAVIDPTLCYGCDLCLESCPFGAIATPRKGMGPHEVDAMRRAACRG